MRMLAGADSIKVNIFATDCSPCRGASYGMNGDQVKANRMTDFESLDIREQIAHIDQMLADAARKRQEIKFAPWQLVLAGMTAGAGFMAAGAAIFAVLLRYVTA